MWPDTDVLLSGLGTIPRDINASQEIVQFFNTHVCASGAAVSNAEAATRIRVFPNPTSDFVRFEGLPGKTNMRCMDAQGRLVATFSIEANDLFEVAGLPEGVYCLLPESGVPIWFVKR